MNKRNKQLLTLAVVGAAAWYLFKRPRLPLLAPVKATPLPTDTMQPGTVEPAAQGLVKDGETLAYLGPM